MNNTGIESMEEIWGQKGNKRHLLEAAWQILLWCLNCSAAFSKPVVQAVQDMEAASSSDSQGFVLMCVCVGLLVLVASTLIIVTITYSYRKKKPDSEK